MTQDSTTTRTKPGPVHIGPVLIQMPLALAPMAGQTNHAFRTLCRDLSGDACGLVCTELLSSNALQHKGLREQSFQLFDWRLQETPFAVQLFGADPTAMGEAARIVVDWGAQIVDINMGCWVPKVAKKGGGAALLRDLDAAAAVVRAVVDAVPATPVTVKVRSGWSVDNPTAVPFAQTAQQLGARAIAVHARFAGQGFTGEADWDVIRQVKQAVTMPVFGNGDIFTPQAAARMLERTGCDGIMIGRGVLGDPWIFRRIAHYLATGEILPGPTPAERATAAIIQARRTLEMTKLPPRKAVLELRGQMLKYTGGLPDPEPIRTAVKQAQSLVDYEHAFAPLLRGTITR